MNPSVGKCRPKRRRNRACPCRYFAWEICQRQFRLHPCNSCLNQLLQLHVLTQLFDQFLDLLRLAFVREFRQAQQIITPPLLKIHRQAFR